MRRLFSLLLAAGCVFACVQAAASPVIVLCYERQPEPPWRTAEGRGLDFELLDEVASRAQVRFEYLAMPWKRCLEQLNRNQVDGAFALSFTRERRGLGAWPGGARPDPAKRLHDDVYKLVRRKGSIVDWDGRQFVNLDGRVGVQLGYAVGDFLRARQVPVDEGSQQADELAQKLAAGRIAAAAFGGADAQRIARGPLGAQLEMLPATLAQRAYFLVLSRAFVAREPQQAGRLWDTVEAVRQGAAWQRHARTVIDAVRH